MKTLNQSIFVLSSILFITAGTAIAADDARELNRSTRYDGTPSDPNRDVRRLILQGTIANAGYSGNDASSYANANGYTLGLLGDFVGHEKLVLEAGALYRHLGSGQSYTVSGVSANYLSIPVAAKYYFNGQEGTSLFAKTGLMESLLLTDSNSRARTWETAFIAGIGAKLNLFAATDLVVEIDYNRAVSSLFDNLSLYRSDLSLGLGVAVNL